MNTMKLFSERYGYVRPRDVFIKEDMPIEVQNAICTCYDELKRIHAISIVWNRLETYVWTNFLNQRLSTQKFRYPVITDYLERKDIPWYKKLDLIEFTLNYFYAQRINPDIINAFIQSLNFHFERLYFGYRVVALKITSITTEEEINTIETAIAEAKDNVREHLNNALKLFANHPEGNWSGSIKESISAIEAYCRELTGKNTLGDALKELQKLFPDVPQVLITAFEKLYVYTNDAKTGIRHALMDATATYTPSSAEAQFMLVSCSAFLNYLKMKVGK